MLSGELLNLSEKYIRDGLNPGELVKGIELAYKKCVELIKGQKILEV